jgi:hypothetical protein
MKKRIFKTMCIVAAVSITSIVGVSCEKEPETGGDYYAKGLQMGKDYCNCLQAADWDTEEVAKCTIYTVPPKGASYEHPKQLEDWTLGYSEGAVSCLSY